MPELPEVEVVKKSLQRNIVGLTIKKVLINNKNLRYKINAKDFRLLSNKKIKSIQRRSKYILINLTKNITILVHLGMTGKFNLQEENKINKNLSFFYNRNKRIIKHDHVVFIFKEKKKLIYNDVRRFGFIKIFLENKIVNNPHFQHLGPEPLSKNFNLDYFKKNILNKKRNIKDILMDQNFVSGLGNIYVNEILYFSGINPTKLVNNLNHEEIKKILSYTGKILKQSIKLGGSSIKDFEHSDGKQGKFQQKFTVYNRKGLKCVKNNCKKLVKKKIISQRATYYCESCQK